MSAKPVESAALAPATSKEDNPRPPPSHTPQNSSQSTILPYKPSDPIQIPPKKKPN
jgi:hypothetical protein